MVDHAENPVDATLPRELPPHMRETVMFMLAHAARQAEQSADEALAPLSLGVRHHAILSSISVGSARSQLAVANSLLMDRTTMARLAGQLESAGLIERRRDSRDRRNYLLRLTPAGRETFAETSARLKTVHHEFLGDLEPDQREFLLRTLRELIR